MDFGFSESEIIAGEVAGTMLRGLAESAAALCLCDDADLIRYANPAFRAAFFPSLRWLPG